MKFLRTAHAWTGVVLAAFVVVIALSGVASVFRGEMIRLSVPAAQAPAPSSATFGAALARFDAAEPGQIRSVKFTPYGTGVHQLILQGGRSVYVDAQGAVVARWAGPSRPEDFALQLHHKLLLGEAGETATGLIGFLTLIMVIVGLIIWAPTWRGFSVRLWPKSMARRDLLAFHRNLGVLVATLLVVSTVTGVGMVFKKSIGPMIGARPAMATPKAPPSEGPANWTAMVDNAQAVYPTAKVRRLFGPRKPGDAYTVLLQQAGEISFEGQTKVFTDAAGKVLGTVDAQKLDQGNRAMNAFLAIHSGMWGGLPTRLIMAFGGLGLSLLALLGAWSFLTKSRAAT